MNIKQNLVSSSKYSVKCPYTMKPEGITVHETANDAPASNEIKYMISNNNEVSFHVAVDEKEAIQGIPFNRNAWAAGDGGSGKGNRTQIHVEICYSKSGGSKYEQAKKNAVKVVAQLCKQFGFTAKNVKQHYDWSKKNCPHRMRAEGKWNWFISELEKELNPPKASEIGKLVCVKADKLWVYDKADWNAKTKQVSKGEAFTILDKLYVDGAWMYKCKYFYITAATQYVQVK